MKKEEVERIFEGALKLVNECSEILRNVDFDKQSTVKADGSLVTNYDLMLDEKLTNGLKELADFPVLSEEHTEEVNGTHYVIDPIDGTHNFSRGFECFGSMVALVENDITLFSIVAVPMLNKTFTAIRGKGAFLNGKRIHVRKVEDRLIGNTNMRSTMIQKWISKLRTNEEYRFEFRSLYCTCVPYSYIASGNFDFAIQYGKMGIWDSLAPKLIIEEAGGICEVQRIDAHRFSVIAGSPEAVCIIKKIIGEEATVV